MTKDMLPKMIMVMVRPTLAACEKRRKGNEWSSEGQQVALPVLATTHGVKLTSSLTKGATVEPARAAMEQELTPE